MTPKRTTTDKVSFPTQDVIHATHSLIALSGIVDAIAVEYETTGVLAVGALRHLGAISDGVIDKLGLTELDVLQEKLPF